MNQEVELPGTGQYRESSAQEQAASAYLVDAMRARGYDEAFVDTAGNAASGAGESARSCLLGHIDTVLGYIPVRQEGDHCTAAAALMLKVRWRVSRQPWPGCPSMTRVVWSLSGLLKKKLRRRKGRDT